MTRHLIVGDPHAHPDFNNKRFDWLGQFIAESKPDHVICIGDFADMPSLCSYDKGKRGFEGRRYRNDVASCLDALRRIRMPIAKRKKKLPKFWMLIGNHEQRIERAVDTDAAQLEGIISLHDLGYKDYGWEVVPYEGSSPGTLFLDGVCYAHYLPTGTSGLPISGIHHAANLINKKLMSCTVGHSHRRDMSSRTRADGKHINGLVTGCYFDYFANYAGSDNHAFWRGVIMKDSVDDGQYDHSFISLKTLRNTYR